MASVDGTVITTSELKEVLNSLKTQRETIKTTYDTMVKKVLESSSSCFSVSGLDYSLIISNFDSTFETIDNNFNSLIDVLENGVIKTYSELAIAIRQMFSEEFATKMSELIGISTSINS